MLGIALGLLEVDARVAAAATAKQKLETAKPPQNKFFKKRAVFHPASAAKPPSLPVSIPHKNFEQNRGKTRGHMLARVVSVGHR